MNTLRKTTIGIRSQATVIFILMAVWYCSVWLAAHNTTGKGYIFDLSLFWSAAFFLLPFIVSAFAVILFISFSRSGQLHPWWVYPALFAAVTPWIYLMLCAIFAV